MAEEGSRNTSWMDLAVEGEMDYEKKVEILLLESDITKDLLPTQVSSSTLCPSPVSRSDPDSATSQSPNVVPLSAPLFPSSGPSLSPEHLYVPSPTSNTSPQHHSYSSYKVSPSNLSLRPIVKNLAPTYRPSHLGIKSKATISSLQSTAPQVSYVPVVFGSGVKSEPAMPPNPPSSNSTPSEASHAGKRRSIVWTAFEKKTIDGRVYAVCNTCTSKLTAGSGYGTRHLLSHMKRCKRVKTFDTRKQAQETNKRIEKGKIEPHNRTFDQEVSRSDIVNAIILHGYPLSIVNHYGLRKFIRGLQPMFKMVTRNTVKKDILKIYDSERDKINCLLEKLDCRVAISTEMWIDKPTKKGYMAINAHFIDEAWVLQSRVVRFIYIPDPHNVEVLTEYLMDALLELSLDRKLSTITVHDAYIIEPAICNFLDKLDASSLLLDGRVLHICCFRDILNLIVKDVLKIVSETIEKVRNIVMYWTVSEERLDEFKEACHQQCVPYTKELCLDVASCWKSTLLMLQTALLYKNVFFYLKQQETCHTSLPSDHDWLLVKEICGNLQPFYNITDFLCRTTDSTINCYFPKICEIKVAISKWIDSPLEIVQVIASETIEKYEKYWGLCHHIIGIACVFDPRYKLKLIEFFFNIIYGDEAMVYVNKIRDDCYALQFDYQSKDVINRNLGASSASSPASMECNEYDPLIKYDLFVASQVPVKSEMDLYLEECVLPRTANFDIFSWWKTNGVKFPTLQKIALDILSIPGSGSASKSSFGNERVLSAHRSRLNHTITEALMCTQNWLRDELNATCSSWTQLVASTFDDEDEDVEEEDDNDDDEILDCNEKN